MEYNSSFGSLAGSAAAPDDELRLGRFPLGASRGAPYDGRMSDPNAVAPPAGADPAPSFNNASVSNASVGSASVSNASVNNASVSNATDINPGSIHPGNINLGSIDYGALTAPLSGAQVRAYRTQIRAQQRANPGVATGIATATTVMGVVFLLFFAGMFLLFFFFILTAGFTETGVSPAVFPPLLVVGLFLVLVIVVMVRHVGSGGPWAKWLRLTTFAAANGLEFRTRSDNPSYPGMIFGIGDSRFAYDHLTSTSGRFFDLGSYEYSTGSGKNRSTSHWGFLALRLDRKLPNMVLDSKANNTFLGSDLPAHFSRDQILSLEGDFDKHFTLYCPKEYETDALYVFTPDVMALFIDDAGSFDVEIVDDWMFVYSPHPLPPLSAATYQRLFTIVQTVGAKTITQTENYHDDRVASSTADVIAPQGQRLRHGVSLGVLVFVGAFGLIFLLSHIVPVLDALH